MRFGEDPVKYWTHAKIPEYCFQFSISAPIPANPWKTEHQQLLFYLRTWTTF